MQKEWVKKKKKEKRAQQRKISNRRDIKVRDKKCAWTGSCGYIIQASVYVNERYLYVIIRKRNIVPTFWRTVDCEWIVKNKKKKNNTLPIEKTEKFWGR